MAAGAGAAAQILSGGDMQLTVGSALNNEYGDITARGHLTVSGNANIRETAYTLNSTHTFDGTWHTVDGTSVSYQQPSISTVIGAVGSKMQGGQGVSISGRSFSLVDVNAGTVGNLRDSVNVIGSGASGASSAGAHATSGNGASGNVGGAVSGSAPGAHAAVAGAASAAGGSSGLGAAIRAAASGMANQTAAGGLAAGSGYANDAATGPDATSSGIGNGSATAGLAGQSGASNDARLNVGVAARANGTQLGNVSSSAGSSAGQQAAGVQGAGLGNVTKVSPNGLFIKSPDASGSYVYETRPQFANQQQWTSSDYLLNQLALDPATTQKRLGDGFYEQRMVREQLSELTGRQSDIGASDDSTYKQLLTNAVSAAQEFGLRPGVALSADQVSRLTSDIVWMESQTVMLPDGSTETVLVPQVYLAHVGQESVKPTGALVAGNGVSINVTESIVNQGGVIDGGNGRTVLVAGQDIVNAGGTIKGGAVALKADGDIRNESLAVKESYDFGPNSGSYTSLSNVATIASTGTLDIMAGRDLVDLAGKISAGTNATLSAGGNIDFSTIQTGSTYQSQIAGVTEKDSSITHQLSQIGTGGDLTIAATGNLNLTGTQVSIGTAGSGAGKLLAGGSINIAAVTNEVKTSVQNEPGVKQYDKQIHENETVVGAGIASRGSLQVGAGLTGSGSLNIVASSLTAGDALALSAKDSVNIVSAQENHLSDTAINRTSSSTFKSKTTEQADFVASSQAVGSSISGKTVEIGAGKDINVLGSAIAGDGDVSLAALGSVNIGASTSTLTESHHKEVKESGFLSGGGFGISYGTRTTTTDQNLDATTQSGQSRSIVGSLGGDLKIVAGDAIKVSGSDLAAAMDMTLDGRSVTIDPGKDDSKGKFEQQTVQDGFTLAVGGSVVNAIQTFQSMGSAASASKDGRVQALAAATTALAAKNAADDIARNGVNVSVSLTVGHSESQYEQTTSNLLNSGSVLNAGNDIKIVASGGGKDSNINIVGSDLNAKGNVTLKADNDVNLLAAQDLESQHSDTKSMSAAAGIGASIGTNGTSIGFTASASVGRGKEDGEGTTQLNTHVTAGNQLTIDSGGDTNIKGAVASGNTVVANIGGDLNIESLQDKAKFDSKNQSVSASGTVGVGASVSGSFSNSTLSSDYASVQEQSGIRAGAGGFDITVKGNTDLKGAVISSAQEAIDQNRNSLTTGTLTVSDIANHANYEGQSIGLSGSYGVAGDKDKPMLPGMSGGESGGLQAMQTGGSGMSTPIALSASDGASSTTRSGISGGVVTINDETKQLAVGGLTRDEVVAGLNRDVSNEKNTSGALRDNFDQQTIQAGFEITGAFAGQVSTYLIERARDIDTQKAIAAAKDDKADALEARTATLLDGPEKEQLQNEIDTLRSAAIDARVSASELDEKWGAGGTYRQIASAITAASSGGVTAAGSEFIGKSVVYWAQTIVARDIKQLAEDYGIEEGSPAHAAMHAISSCAGAAAGGADCSTAALAVAGTTVLSSLLSAQDVDKLTNQQKEDREALVRTLVSGAAGLAGADIAAANTAALIEMQNNSNVTKAVKEAIDTAQAYVAENGKQGLEGVGKLLEKLEVKTLVEKRDLISKYLEEAGARGGLTDTEIAALGILYAANQTLFPTSVLDIIPGAGKAISKTGTLIKNGYRAVDAARIATVEAKVISAGEKIPKIEIAVASGEKGDWSKVLNKPEPNKIYNVNDRYLYHTDDLGRVEKVEGTLSSEVFDRNKYQQCLAGKCGDVGDEGGHLIASIFGGPGEKLNIVPMDGNLNKSGWKKLEILWANELKAGNTVSVRIQPLYEGASVRPASFQVQYTIGDGRPITRSINNVAGGI